MLLYQNPPPAAPPPQDPSAQPPIGQESQYPPTRNVTKSQPHKTEISASNSHFQISYQKRRYSRKNRSSAGDGPLQIGACPIPIEVCPHHERGLSPFHNRLSRADVASRPSTARTPLSPFRGWARRRRGSRRFASAAMLSTPPHFSRKVRRRH